MALVNNGSTTMRNGIIGASDSGARTVPAGTDLTLVQGALDGGADDTITATLGGASL